MSAERLLTPRVIELGKIKIGGLGVARTSAAGGAYRVPRKDDHFTITTLTRDQAGDFAPDLALMAALASAGYADPDGKLRRLPVTLLSHVVDEVLPVAYVWYLGKTLAARGDGRTLTLYLDRERTENLASPVWLKTPAVTPWDDDCLEWSDGTGAPCMRLFSTLNCVINSPAARWGGYYKFRTKSAISATQLFGSLDMARRLTGGALRGVPFELVVRPYQVTPEGRAITVYVVHLQIVGSDLLALQARVREQLRVELDQAREVRTASAEYRKALAITGAEPVEDLADDEDLLDLDPPAPPVTPRIAGGPVLVEPIAEPDPAELWPDELQVNEFIRLMRAARTRVELAAVGTAVKVAEGLTHDGREILRNEYRRVEAALPGAEVDAGTV